MTDTTDEDASQPDRPVFDARERRDPNAEVAAALDDFLTIAERERIRHCLQSCEVKYQHPSSGVPEVSYAVSFDYLRPTSIQEAIFDGRDFGQDLVSVAYGYENTDEGATITLDFTVKVTGLPTHD